MCVWCTNEACIYNHQYLTLMHVCMMHGCVMHISMTDGQTDRKLNSRRRIHSPSWSTRAVLTGYHRPPQTPAFEKEAHIWVELVMLVVEGVDAAVVVFSTVSLTR